jgi:hypothetical protein
MDPIIYLSVIVIYILHIVKYILHLFNQGNRK